MRPIVLALFFVTAILLETECYAKSHYCYTTGYRSTKTCTSGWVWSRRCNYKLVPTQERICCENYYGDNCDKPKCGDWNLDITCNVADEGMVIYKDGRVVTDSSGKCVAPSTCEDCNQGFYPNSEFGKCKACPRFEKCNVHICTNTNDVTCLFCHNEFNREKKGWNEYTGLPDQKQCTRTCSWVEGFRCYPGSCGDDHYRYYDSSGRTNCKCANGFMGTDCKTGF